MKMKKTAAFLCTAALACSMSFPAFAAQTRAEYKEESSQVRQELEETGNTMKRIQEESRAAADRLSELRKAQKDAGQLKENRDTWKQVKELKGDITGLRVSYTESNGQAKLLKAQARDDVKDGRYDEALAKLDRALSEKKEALGYLEQIDGIWDQIDQLIN